MSTGATHSPVRQSAGFHNPIGWVFSSAGTFWATVLLIASVNVTMFDLVQETEGDAFRVDPLVLMRLGACAAFGLFGLLYLRRTLAQLCTFPAAWNTMLVVWAALTVPFSVSPTFSAAGVFTLLCVTLFVPAVLAELGGERTIKVLLAGLVIYVGLNWLVAVAAPSLVDTSFKTVGGDTSHRFGNDPQQLGLQTTWALGFLLVLALSKRLSARVSIVLLLGLVLTLALSLSRTAIMASVVVTSVALWPHLSGRQRALAFASTFLLIGTILLATASGRFAINTNAVVSTVSRSGDTEELRTFTGRVDVWKYAWGKCLDSPLFGYGYGTSRFVLQEDPNYPLKFQANHAHNLFLNTALTIGLPGALLLIVMIAHLALRNMRLSCSVPSITLAFVVTGSVTESLLYGAMPRSHMFIWLIAMFWQQMHMHLTSNDGAQSRGRVV
jgi:O-antigen ligase